MILGGAALIPEEELKAEDAAAGALKEDVTPRSASGVEAEEPNSESSHRSSSDVLRTTAFWNGLEGYIKDQVNDGQEAARLTSVFKKSWESL